MDSIHDLGGRQGFGTVVRERNEPVFHEPWEASVYAMVVLVRHGSLANVDRFRHAIERIDPAAYLTHTYYGRWLGGLEALFEEEGLVTGDQIDRRMRELGGVPAHQPIVRAARPNSANAIGARSPDTPDGARRQVAAKPRFQVGDPVITDPHGHSGHTRLPAYARHKRGAIQSLHDAWVFPDTNAHGRGEHPCHLYTVKFPATELWGEDGDAASEVCIDLFEPYLHKLETTSP